MTRINRVRRLASLRPSTTPLTYTRASFITTRNISSTPCLKADEPPAQEDTEYIENVSERTSRLRLPPKQSIADTEAEIAAADPTYTPATSIADLEPLPEMKSWWHQPGHWGPESQFSGFGVGARQRITDPSLVKVMLRRAVVEVQSLQKLGQYDAMKFKKWSIGGVEEMQRIMKGDLAAEDGAAIAASLTTVEEAEQANSLIVPTVAEAEAAVNSWDTEWLSLPLDDETKFVIRKRLYQLTGTLLPDAKLAAAKTVRDIATFASVAPKPKKLYQVLQAEAQSLPPNLKIHGRRITPIDREKAVGRWKIIEEELKKRDLPVTGHGNVASHREKVWLLGKR